MTLFLTIFNIEKIFFLSIANSDCLNECLLTQLHTCVWNVVMEGEKNSTSRCKSNQKCAQNVEQGPTFQCIQFWGEKYLKRLLSHCYPPHPPTKGFKWKESRHFTNSKSWMATNVCNLESFVGGCVSILPSGMINLWKGKVPSFSVSKTPREHLDGAWRQG